MAAKKELEEDGVAELDLEVVLTSGGVDKLAMRARKPDHVEAFRELRDRLRTTR